MLLSVLEWLNHPDSEPYTFPPISVWRAAALYTSTSLHTPPPVRETHPLTWHRVQQTFVFQGKKRRLNRLSYFPAAAYIKAPVQETGATLWNSSDTEKGHLSFCFQPGKYTPPSLMDWQLWISAFLGLEWSESEFTAYNLVKQLQGICFGVTSVFCLSFTYFVPWWYRRGLLVPISSARTAKAAYIPQTGGFFPTYMSRSMGDLKTVFWCECRSEWLLMMNWQHDQGVFSTFGLCVLEIGTSRSLG